LSPSSSHQPRLRATALSLRWIRHFRPLTSVVEVALGGYHACGRREDGTVVCWGSNEDGQLGDGGTKHSKYPVVVQGLSDAVRIVSGTSFTCALRRDRSVFCWGEITRAHPGPTVVTNALRIAAANDYACALLADERVVCWGQGWEEDDWYPPTEVRFRLEGQATAASTMGLRSGSLLGAQSAAPSRGLICRWPDPAERLAEGCNPY
jgi:alpha-tubulin suppressor-like RCC1 family protein